MSEHVFQKREYQIISLHAHYLSNQTRRYKPLLIPKSPLLFLEHDVIRILLKNRLRQRLTLSALLSSQLKFGNSTCLIWPSQLVDIDLTDLQLESMAHLRNIIHLLALNEWLI